LVSPNLLIFWIPFMGYLAYRSSKNKIIFVGKFHKSCF